jgi:LacI family gluconate utilization system Gnt-I transcriptional repressor
VRTIANAIFADTVQGLTDEVEPRGYTVILAQPRYDDAQEARKLMALLSRRPEALVMVGSPAKPASEHLLRRAGIPVVETWDLPARPIDAVAGFDNRAAGIIVARHFAAAGRRGGSPSLAAMIRAPPVAGKDSGRLRSKPDCPHRAVW